MNNLNKFLATFSPNRIVLLQADYQYYDSIPFLQTPKDWQYTGEGLYNLKTLVFKRSANRKPIKIIALRFYVNAKKVAEIKVKPYMVNYLEQPYYLPKKIFVTRKELSIKI